MCRIIVSSTRLYIALAFGLVSLGLHCFLGSSPTQAPHPPVPSSSAAPPTPGDTAAAGQSAAVAPGEAAAAAVPAVANAAAAPAAAAPAAGAPPPAPIPPAPPGAATAAVHSGGATATSRLPPHSRRDPQRGDLLLYLPGRPVVVDVCVTYPLASSAVAAAAWGTGVSAEAKHA